MCGARYVHSTQNNKFTISLQYLKENVKDESSQNSKFAMSLQYLKKEVRDEVDILHAD